jgi:hypothetical protein
LLKIFHMPSFATELMATLTSSRMRDKIGDL